MADLESVEYFRGKGLSGEESLNRLKNLFIGYDLSFSSSSHTPVHLPRSLSKIQFSIFAFNLNINFIYKWRPQMHEYKVHVQSALNLSGQKAVAFLFVFS